MAAATQLLAQTAPESSLDQTSPGIVFPNVLNKRSSGPEIRYSIKGNEFSDDDVDHWELRASRRALANLKTLLYGSPMLELVRTQCEQGDAYFKSLLSASGDQWDECRTDMHVNGVCVRDLMNARKKLANMSERSRALETLLPAHPEHYAKATDEGQEGVIEIIGEHMMNLRMVTTDDVPGFVHSYADSTYTFKKPTVVKLQDGTTAYYILHEFCDVKDGCKLRLRVVFPAAAPEVMFSEHAEHMAIEFRFGVKSIDAGF